MMQSIQYQLLHYGWYHYQYLPQMIEQHNQQSHPPRAQQILAWRFSSEHKRKTMLNLSNCEEWFEVMHLYIRQQKQRKHKLYHLNLSNCKITPPQLAGLMLGPGTWSKQQQQSEFNIMLKSCLNLSKIRVLDLSNTRLGKSGVTLLTKIDWVNLKSLSLCTENCGIRNEGLAHLMKLKCKWLVTLDIRESCCWDNKPIILYGLNGLQFVVHSNFKHLCQFHIFYNAQPITLLTLITMTNKTMSSLNIKMSKNIHDIMKSRFINYF